MHIVLMCLITQVCGEYERASLGYIGREEAADEGVALTYVVCSLAELEVLDVRKQPNFTSAQQVMSKKRTSSAHLHVLLFPEHICQGVFDMILDNQMFCSCRLTGHRVIALLNVHQEKSGKAMRTSRHGETLCRCWTLKRILVGVED